jgi:hypothetical protein
MTIKLILTARCLRKSEKMMTGEEFSQSSKMAWIARSENKPEIIMRLL